MADYKPRNRNRPVNEDSAPLSWSQRFYDGRRNPDQRAPCGFHIPDGGKA